MGDLMVAQGRQFGSAKLAGLCGTTEEVAEKVGKTDPSATKVASG
jgi:hypothetical protein